MTLEQQLQELRKELFASERITKLLKDVGKAHADAILRKTFQSVDHADLLRLTGAAQGVEHFIKHITDSPQTARQTGQAHR